jgi:outer membrane protein assembly factor BamB
MTPLPDSEPAEIVREYGPFPDAPHVHGVTYDGRSIWFAAGAQLIAIAPDSGERVRALAVPAKAGSAFDGRHLYQLADGFIQTIDPGTGEIIARVASPAEASSGLAWAEGYLWIGDHNTGKVHQVEPATGAIVRTLSSDRFVTGVTWVQGELWHGASKKDAPTELRQIDPATGSVRRRLEMPAGAYISGVESDGADVMYCGGGVTGKLRAVRRSQRRTLG